jgi:hypothetical protein
MEQVILVQAVAVAATQGSQETLEAVQVALVLSSCPTAQLSM